MIDLSKYKNIYFLGIGGIGMSAIARWFNVNGYAVAGYDKTSTLLTETLRSEGISIHFEDDVSAIPKSFHDAKKTLVVRTPAVPAGHSEWAFFEANGYQILKRAAVLGLLTKEMYLLGVAGTHGKTTTSSMLAHLLKASGKNTAAFLGGITQNYQTNFLLNAPTDNLREVACVVEADEYDRSFLTLFPNIAIVTSTDADHLDIYGSGDEVLRSFEQFVGQVSERLFIRDGLTLATHTPANVETYGFDTGDYHTENFTIEAARFCFDIRHPEGLSTGFQLRMPGFHNVENAIACFAVGKAVGLSEEQLREGINTFRGVKRRFEYHVESEDIVYIDDYAHHPTELSACLTSVRALYPTRKITVIFQPHLFSRTRDFCDGFAEALDLSDTVWLLDIYPARELPMEGVSSEIIFEKMQITDKLRCGKAEILGLLEKYPPEVLVTIGAGDIDTLVPLISTFLQAKS